MDNSTYNHKEACFFGTYYDPTTQFFNINNICKGNVKNARRNAPFVWQKINA